MRASLWLVGSLALASCVRRPASDRVIGAHDERDRIPEKPAEPEKKRPPIPIDTVQNAALPFGGVRVSDCGEMAPDDLLKEISRADVVCIGEEHSNPHSHWAELRILESLAERRTMNGREVAVGIEMLPRTTQRIVEKWSAGKIGETELLTEADWEQRWGYDFGYYRPQLELARSNGLSVVALNAPRELTHEVSTNGINSLDDKKLKLLPELDLSDNEHRTWFKEQMSKHPHSKSSFDNMYAAQVIWDETMADTAARWVSGRLPGRQLVIFAGSGHCRKKAIPKRILRRVQAKVVGVLPTVGADTKAACEKGKSFDYVFSMQASDDD